MQKNLAGAVSPIPGKGQGVYHRGAEHRVPVPSLRSGRTSKFLKSTLIVDIAAGSACAEIIHPILTPQNSFSR